MAASDSEPVGSLAVALDHTARLLASDPAMAEQQAREILRAVPGHPQAQLLLGAALRTKGDLSAALAVLEPLARNQPNAAVAHFELGRTLGALGRTGEAATALFTPGAGLGGAALYVGSWSEWCRNALPIAKG